MPEGIGYPNQAPPQPEGGQINPDELTPENVNALLDQVGMGIKAINEIANMASPTTADAFRPVIESYQNFRDVIQGDEAPAPEDRSVGTDQPSTMAGAEGAVPAQRMK